MIGNVDQIQDRWQRVEADRPPERRKERSFFGRTNRRKSRKGALESHEEHLEDAHLDIRA